MTKKQTKGFTLIELLAVIVILAVVALVATPIIIASVSNAKKSAANTSALGYVDAVNKYIGLNDVEPDNYPYTLQNGVYYVSGTDTSKTYLNDIIKVTGNKPESGWVLVQDREVVQYSFKIDEYIVSEVYTTNEQNNEQEETNEESLTKTIVKAKGDNVSPVAIPENSTVQILENSSSNQFVSGVTSENPTGQGVTGVIKIVYLDPTDLTNECNDTNFVSTTNTKSGCMRWYVYSETSTEYKMLLDHNTTARIEFSNTVTSGDDTLSGEDMVEEIQARLNDDTISNSDTPWQVDENNIQKIKSVSVITGDEIAVITGKTNATTTWNPINNPFSFNVKATYTESSRNPYAWLFNKTYGCKDGSKDYGCIELDNTGYKAVKKSGTSWLDAGSGPMYGYWTRTPDESSPKVYRSNNSGELIIRDASNKGGGIRPVITISKSLIN